MRDQLMEMEESIKSLMHICYCQDESCGSPSCERMRKIVYHTKACRIKVKRQCPICNQLIKICFYHARYCKNSNCAIPLCSRMKLIIMEQELKERLEHAKLRRSQLVEMMRQPNQRASKRPPG